MIGHIAQTMPRPDGATKAGWALTCGAAAGCTRCGGTDASTQLNEKLLLSMPAPETFVSGKKVKGSKVIGGG